MDYIFIDSKNRKEFGLVKNSRLFSYDKIKEELLRPGTIIRAEKSRFLAWLDCYEIKISNKETGLLPVKDIVKAAENENTCLLMVKTEKLKDKKQRLTEKLTLKGNYILVDFFSKGVNISKKIEDDKLRKKLRDLILKEKPSYGIVIRTEAGRCDSKDFLDEYKKLVGLADKIMSQLNYLPNPKVLYEEEKPYINFALENSKDDIKVIVNEEKIKDLLIEKGLERSKIIYDESYFSNLDENISNDISSVSKKSVVVEKAEIVIEVLEALTVIDINSRSSNMNLNKEENALKVNLMVTEEIIRQLSFRKIRGIVIVDYIRVDEKKREQIVTKFHEIVTKYDLKVRDSSFNKLGLFEFIISKSWRLWAF